MSAFVSTHPESPLAVGRLRDGSLAPLGVGLLVAFALIWAIRPGALGATVVLASFGLPAGWCSFRCATGVTDARRWRGTSFLLALTSLPLAFLGFLLVGATPWVAPRALSSLCLAAVVAAVWTSEVCFRHVRAKAAELPTRSLGGTATFGVFEGSARLTAPAIACILMVLDYGAWSEARRADAERTDWALEALDEVVASGIGRPLAARVQKVLSTSMRRPKGAEAFTISRDGRIESLEPGSAATMSLSLLEWVDDQRAAGHAVGAVHPPGGRHVAAYRSLEDGRVLVLRVDRAPLRALWPVQWEGWGFLALLGLGLAWQARTFERPRREAVARVESMAARLAEGDLDTLPLVVAGEGELSRVERDLARVAQRIGTTIERAAGVGDTFGPVIEELERALAGIHASERGRSEELVELRRAVARIQEQTGEATRKADTLDRALDESTHSVSELGTVGAELNETAAVLTSRVDAVSDSLEQMVRSVKAVGATTGRLAEASEETSSSMEEMASAMRAVDNAAETTANLSAEVVEKAELGQAKVVQTIAGMEAIREATDAAERVIRGLGARTKEIGGILDVIDDVADETNLLALNAAIIAAQAGEHGKAFSVVADEIKELADRVLASTKEIGALIRAVQEESENAIGAIEAGSSSVMSGVDLSAEAGRTLEEITVASRESGARIREIVGSVREQTKAASHVVVLMDKVRESADQIGAASAQQEQGNEVVYRSALTMREVAQQLQNTTAEQATGLARIRDNAAGVRGVLDEISGSLASQAECCDEVSRRLAVVEEQGRSEGVAAQTIRRTLDELGERLTQLREDLEGYRRTTKGAGLEPRVRGERR